MGYKNDNISGVAKAKPSNPRKQRLDDAKQEKHGDKQQTRSLSDKTGKIAAKSYADRSR